MAGGAKLAFMVSPFSSTSDGSAWIPGYLTIGMGGPELLLLPVAPATTAVEARFPSPPPGPGVRASRTVADASANAAAVAAAASASTAPAADSPFSQTPSTASLTFPPPLSVSTTTAEDIKSPTSPVALAVEGPAIPALGEMCLAPPPPPPLTTTAAPVALPLVTACASPAGAALSRTVVLVVVVVVSSAAGVDFSGRGGVGSGGVGSGGDGGASVQIVLKDGFFTTSVSLFWIFSHASLET